MLAPVVVRPIASKATPPSEQPDWRMQPLQDTTSNSTEGTRAGSWAYRRDVVHHVGKYSGEDEG